MHWWCCCSSSTRITPLFSMKWHKHIRGIVIIREMLAKPRSAVCVFVMGCASFWGSLRHESVIAGGFVFCLFFGSVSSPIVNKKRSLTVCTQFGDAVCCLAKRAAMKHPPTTVQWARRPQTFSISAAGVRELTAHREMLVIGFCLFLVLISVLLSWITWS